MRQRFFKLAARIEQWAAGVQGKGSGAASIRHEVYLACSLLKSPPGLAIDIGGNIGNYTAELRLGEPALEIHVFEPSRKNARTLRDRFSEDRLIHVVPVAVSDVKSQAVLYSDKEGSGLASLARRRLDHFGIPFEKQESVQTLRFEDYWKDVLHKRTIDLVKMDVEGHELTGLKGFGEALDHVRVIQFEFGGCNIDSRTYFQDFWYFFRERSVEFRLNRVTPWGLQEIPRYSERDEFFCTTNYVAARVEPNQNA